MRCGEGKDNGGAAGKHAFVIAESLPTNLPLLPLCCVRLDFHAIADEVIAKRLIAEGVAQMLLNLPRPVRLVTLIAHAGRNGPSPCRASTHLCSGHRRSRWFRVYGITTQKRIETLIHEAAEP